MVFDRPKGSLSHPDSTFPLFYLSPQLTHCHRREFWELYRLITLPGRHCKFSFIDILQTGMSPDYNYVDSRLTMKFEMMCKGWNKGKYRSYQKLYNSDKKKLLKIKWENIYCSVTYTHVLSRYIWPQFSIQRARGKHLGGFILQWNWISQRVCVSVCLNSGKLPPDSFSSSSVMLVMRCETHFPSSSSCLSTLTFRHLWDVFVQSDLQ